MTLPFDFDILAPVLVAHQRMHVDGAERLLVHEVQPHHHHAGDPEEDDVEAGHQNVGRVVGRQLRRPVGPAERRERPQRRGKPGVEHVLVAGQDLARLEILQLSSTRPSIGPSCASNTGSPRAAPPPRSSRRRPCRRARTRPGSGAPTRAGARCTRAGCSPSSRNRSSPSSSARTWCGPRAPRRSPAWPSSAALTYHWSVRNGSIGTPPRSPCGTA